MLQKKDELFARIIRGYPNAYSDFLQAKNEESLVFLFEELFNFIIEEKDLSKCDYYALYDALHYLLCLSKPKEEKDIIAKKFIAKLDVAAEKGNVSAQCCFIILNNFSDLKIDKSNSLKAFRHVAFSYIVKNQKNTKQRDLLNWFNLFLAVYKHQIDKETRGETFAKNLAGKHSILIHYALFHISPASENHAILSDYMLNHKNKSCQLITLNLYCAESIIRHTQNNKITYSKNSRLLEDASIMLSTFSDYNPARSDYYLGYYYLIRTDKKKALHFFELAFKKGFAGAEVAVKVIEKELQAEANKSTNNVDSPSKVIKPREIRRNRDFLINHSEHDIIKIHSNLVQESHPEQKNVFAETIIEQQLFSEILLQIETNKKITVFNIENVYYKFDLSKLLQSLEKSQSIDTLKIIYTKLSMRDALKLFFFVEKHENIKNFQWIHCCIDYEGEDPNKYFKIYHNAIIKLVENIRHLEKFELSGIFDEHEEFRSLFLAMKKNQYLSKTKITLGDCKFDNNNLLLLAELLNSNIGYINIISSENDFDAKSLKEFARKLKGNTTLKHLGLKMFIESSDVGSDVIMASHKLFKKLIKKTQVESLDLTDTIYTLKSNGIKDLTTSLRSCKSLKIINLSGNGFEDDVIVQLAYAFKNSNSLEHIILKNNPYSHKGVEALADVLSNYPNNLKVLDLQEIDEDFAEDDEKVINANRLFKAFAKIVSSPFCRLTNLYVHIVESKDDDSHSFEKFMAALVSNETIRYLRFSGSMTNKKLMQIIDVVEKNENIIDVRYEADLDYVSSELEPVLQQKLRHNLSIKPLETINRNNPLTQAENVTIVEKNQQPIIISRPKADKNTFVEVLKNTKVNSEVNVDENQTLTINFLNNDLAERAAKIFNHSKNLAICIGSQVIFSNYNQINAIDILSASLLISRMQTSVQKLSIIHSPLLNYLKGLKCISIVEDKNDLCLSIVDVSNSDSVHAILKSISRILAARQISASADGKNIIIYDHKDIPNDKIVGISSEIKQQIKEQIMATKTPINNATYSIVQDKLKTRHLRKQLIKNTEKKHAIKKVSEKQQVEQKEEKVGEVLTPSLNLIPIQENVECILNNTFMEFPTNEKFRKFSKQIMNEDNNTRVSKKFDNIMRLIFIHHESLLNMSSMPENKIKEAYWVLYHSIRISELTNSYLLSNQNANNVLGLSAYGIRTILLDRTDYFLPNSVENALLWLNDHHHSFLTISRQILMDFFGDSSNLKTKLQSGYKNVVFYKNFYENLPNPKVKLPLPDLLTKNITNVITSMKSVIEFAQSYLGESDKIPELFSGNSLTNINLCAIKGALFLLGHFSRILRDYHGKFLRECFSTVIAKNNYSLSIQSILLDTFEQSQLFSSSFLLLEHISKIIKPQLLAIAQKANFIDYCLLFIEARNIMGHNKEDASGNSPVVNVFEEIPLPTIVYLSKYFISNKSFNHVLDNILELSRKFSADATFNSEETSSSSQQSLNPFAPVFNPSNDAKQEIIYDEEESQLNSRSKMQGF